MRQHRLSSREVPKMSSSPDDPIPTQPPPFNTAIVGGGKGCESFIRMVEEDKLGRFRLRICGVAEIDPEAPGIRLARELGITEITTDYHELYEIEPLGRGLWRQHGMSGRGRPGQGHGYAGWWQTL